MKDIEIRMARSRKDLDQIFKIRELVFVKEQGVAKNIVNDELDKKTKHLIMFYRNKPIGCARVWFIDKKAVLQRIAVLKRYRNRGFGKALMEYLIKYCRKRKANEIVMHSQYYIRNFYTGLGFLIKGRAFKEAGTGIKHIDVHMKLE